MKTCTILKEKVQNVVSFHEVKRKLVLHALDVKSGEDTFYNRGISLHLHSVLDDTSVLLQQAKKVTEAMREEDEDELYWSNSDLEDYGAASDDDDMDMLIDVRFVVTYFVALF